MQPSAITGDTFTPLASSHTHERTTQHEQITGLDKAEVLAALYNGAAPQGRGFLHFVPGDATPGQMSEVIAARGGNLDFDYLQGRVMKVHLSGDEFDPWLYDRDTRCRSSRNRGTAPKTGVMEQSGS